MVICLPRIISSKKVPKGYFAVYIVNKMKEESGLSGIKVIATGGLGRMISNETDAIDVFDSLLTLQGLRLIRNRCRGIR